MIPARYEAARFPGKLLEKLGDLSVILQTYRATVATQLFDEVYVVTDSDLIYTEITNDGGIALMSEKDHECGSDRIAEAVANLDVDIVVNVQGDEPFTKKEPLAQLIDVFKNDSAGIIDLASIKTPINDAQSIDNPNTVKVITDKDDFAIYFSRAPIPFVRATDVPTQYYKHLGIYAFRKQAIMDFSTLSKSPLELAEKIECLRFIEHGKKIKMITSTQVTFGIDTPDDLEKANLYLQSNL